MEQKDESANTLKKRKRIEINSTIDNNEHPSDGDPMDFKEYMKMKISKALKESPYQSNSKNIASSFNTELLDGICQENYKHEIKEMMYSIGEVRDTPDRNITLIEEELLKYWSSLLNKLRIITARTKTRRRGTVTLDDLGKALLPCCRSIALVEYLSHWIKKIKTIKNDGQSNTFTLEIDGSDSLVTIKDNKEVGVKKDEHWKPNEELASRIQELDPTWTQQRIEEERMASRLIFDITNNMTEQEYLKWQSCCKVSFIRPSKKTKFLKYLKANCQLEDMQLDKQTMEALSFLGKDHLQRIVLDALRNKASSSEAIQPINLKTFIEKAKIGFDVDIDCSG